MSRVHGFVDAFSSGKPETLVAFLRENATPEWLAERPESDRRSLFGRVMEELGAVEIEGVRFDGRATVTVRTAAERVDAPVTFELLFEPAEPYRIAGVGIDVGAPAGLPDDLPPPPDLEDLGETARAALDRYFRELAAADRFAGTVLLALDGEPVFEGAYGPADRSWDVPNAMSTRFDVGSINKDFTKVAVGQLLAAGTLALDDTILDLLPDYPNPEAGRKITVRHLLEHTSGLGDLFGPEFFRTNKALLRTNRDYFPLFADEPLRFEPGTGRSYSNAGYIVLGAIVAEVSGMPFAESIERHVFEPAGMTGAAFAARDEIHPDVAVGYTRQASEGSADAPLRPNLFMLPVVGMGAGSAVATAADLLAFDRALREHRLLDPRWTEWFFTGELPPEGFAPPAGPVDHPIGIAGGAPGVNAILEGDAAHTVVVLSNVDPPTAEALGLELSRRLREVVLAPRARKPRRGSTE
jgi:CubicO group peptidase (beta-lactamase class C family)